MEWKKKLLATSRNIKIMAIVLVLIALVFCIYIARLEMIPDYLKISCIAIGIVYIVLLLFILPLKMNKIIKGILYFVFIAIAFVFSYGVYFSDKTIEVLDKINYNLSEKEYYSINVLNSNEKIKTKNDLNGKTIGIFKNEKYDDVVKYLKKDVDCNLIDYTNPAELFEDLSTGKIDGVIASDMIYVLLDEDLSYMQIEMKTIHIVEVPFDGNNDEIVKVVDVTNTPFNIFIAGGDKAGPIDGHMNTDVNMIVSVDPVNRKLLLTSIPRDYYVHLGGREENVYDKLTHANYYGVKGSVKTVEELLDIDINYYVKINFTTVTTIVDAIGGVDIYNPRAFRSRVGDYYEKGWIHLNGKYALAFSRERKAFSNGDVTRVQNQQLVLEAMIKKITSSKKLLLSYDKILNSVSENMATNMDSSSISRLVKMQISDMKSWTISTQHLDGTPDATYGCFSIPNYYLYILRPDKNSIEKAKKTIDAFFDGKELLKQED